MITGELKSQIDKIWDAFWTGGVSNPLTVIEQITYLLFIRRLDDIQNQKEQKANFLKIPIEDPLFSEQQKNCRWGQFVQMPPQEKFEAVRDDVFPFLRELGDKNSVYGKYMKGATFMIPTPRLLTQVTDMLQHINMDDQDTNGDLYEYLLSKIASAGKNGQFRTPRHIIKMIVRLMQPKPDDTVCDPSCGTAGFLVAFNEFLRENHPETFTTYKEHYKNQAFNGLEFDATMIRIGAMNLLLHGIENPNLNDRDALSSNNAHLKDKYSLILANPPFKGSLDYESVAPDLLKVIKTKKTELLFLALMLRMLKVGGRCACIVPDGVLFGSSRAHKNIRKIIAEGNHLQAVISMPSGVFKPYAGVSTAILIFQKTNSGGTENVWFYEMKSDGFSLDDKRNKLDNTGDIPQLIERFHNLETEKDRKRTENSFLVPLSEIKKNGYDLSINRYKEIEYEEVEYAPPAQIIQQIQHLQNQQNQGLIALEKLLKT